MVSIESAIRAAISTIHVLLGLVSLLDPVARWQSVLAQSAIELGDREATRPSARYVSWERGASLRSSTKLIRATYFATGINCIRIMPYSAVQFASYEQFKKLFTKNGTVPLDTSLRLTAGALAGICSVCATYPLDLVRSRLSIISASIGSANANPAMAGPGTAALIRQKELGILGMTAKVFKEEGGLRGLYRGIGPTAAG